jgi:hypothetical protein
MMTTGVDANLVISDAEQASKTFTAAEFRQVMDCASLIGAVRFWRAWTVWPIPNCEPGARYP